MARTTLPPPDRSSVVRWRAQRVATDRVPACTLVQHCGRQVSTKRSGKGSAERNRTVKDVISQNFVRDLLIDADQTGGTLTFEKNARSGTLIDAVTLLTEHLPEGVNAEKLSASTLQRIKNTYRNFYTGAIEAGFEPADVLPGPHSEDQTK